MTVADAEPGQPLPSTALAIATDGFLGAVLIPSEDYQMFLIERPDVAEEELSQSIRWLLDAKLDYPSVDANIAWFDVPQHESMANRPRQQYVVAAPKNRVDQRVSAAEDAGIAVQIVDVRETARRNIAALIEKRVGPGVCLIIVEADGLQILVSFGGELYLERFIRERVLDPADAEIQGRQFDRIALEIQRTLDFLQRNYPFVTLSAIVLTPLPPEIGLLAGLAARLNEPVRELELRDYFEWPTDSEFNQREKQTQYLSAIGAALRFSESITR